MGKVFGKLSLVLFIVLSVSAPEVSHAQFSFGLSKPFGGRIAFPLFFPLICPPHLVIKDVTGIGLGSEIGIIPTGKLYNYRNLFTPGVWTLGNRSSEGIKCPPFPYTIYKMQIMGTSLTP
jgi:hypothetical protein